MLKLFSHEESNSFIEEICRIYGRYRRDQLLLLQKVAVENPEWIYSATEKCIHEKLYSANDFRDVVAFLKRTQSELILETTAATTQTVSIPVQTRDLQEYIHRMGGKSCE